MIKKLLFMSIILCLLCVNGKEVLAQDVYKDLIITKGNQVDLNLDGYLTLETNVDFNQEGKYYVIYQNKQTSEKIKRNIEVITKESLKEGIIKKGADTLINYENYKVIKTVKTKDSYASILCGYDTYYYHLEKTDIYYPLGKTSELDIFNLLYDEHTNNTYLLGHNYTSRFIDINLCCFDSNGNCLFRKTYGGSLQDEALNMLIQNDMIVICGKTRSSNGIFTHVVNQEDSFLLYVNKQNGEVFKYLDLSMPGIDYIDEIVYMDSLYVIVHYFYNNVPMAKITKINNKFEIETTSYINCLTIINVISFKTDGTNLYLLYTAQQNKKELFLYKIDSLLNKTLLYNESLNNTLVYDLDLTSKEIKIIYYDLEKKLIYMKIYTNDEFKVYEFSENTTSGIYSLDNGNIYIKQGDSIIIIDYQYIIIKENNYQLKLYINDVSANFDNEKSNTFVDKNIYGYYDVSYYFVLSRFDLLYIDTFFIRDDINVLDNNIYTKGIILNFNGEGYLNGKKITNNYQINIPGKYKLTLVGYKNLVKNVNFNVTELNNQLEENKKIWITEEESDSNIQDINVSQNTAINYLTTPSINNQMWYTLIPFIFIIFFLIINYLIERKFK